MITRIEALNYRCLRRVEQDLGPFHVLVGPNGSGKSTFLDVPALMRDIVRDGRLDIGDVITSRAPNYTDLFWMGAGSCFQVAMEVEIPEERRSHLPPGFNVCRYDLGIGRYPDSEELRITKEMFSVGPTPSADQRRQRSDPFSLDLYLDWLVVQKLQTDGMDYFRKENDPSRMQVYRTGFRRSALANMPEDETLFPVATWFKQSLLPKVQTLALNSLAMRWPSSPAAKRSFQPDGSSLPWILESFLADPQSLAVQQWLEHVRIAIPELRAVRVVERSEDRNRYLKLTYGSGLELPSWLVSDGTLRFLALSLLPYLPEARGTYLVEEPENGIHPTAVELVFQALSSVRGGQVLVATHSPAILGLADVDKILCFRKSEDGSVSIVPGNEHRNLRHWKGEVSLDVLFAGGVLG